MINWVFYDNLSRLFHEVVYSFFRDAFQSILFGCLGTIVVYRVRVTGNRGKNQIWLYIFRVFPTLSYLYFLLRKTVIGRNYYEKPLEVLWDNWEIFDEWGRMQTGTIENILLFFPLMILLFHCRKQRVEFKMMFGLSVIIPFSISTMIESAQLIYHLGTFQISDIFFNTFGGLAGGLIYYIICKAKNRIGKFQKV